MISQRSLSTFRCGAAVCAATPSTKLHIGVGKTRLIEVSKPPFSDNPQGRVVPVCSFARAVANAHTDQLAGKNVGFVGLEDGQEPWVRFGVVPGDVVIAGGVLRVVHQERWLHLLPMPAVGDSIELLVADLIDDDCRINRHVDLPLEVTIAHIDTEIGDRNSSCTAIEKLIDLSASFMVEQVETHLSSSNSQTSEKNPSRRRG